MPAFCVSVDEEIIVTVCTGGYDILSIQVSGTLIDQEFSKLNVTGGKYSGDEDTKHLIWVSEMPLRANQTVAVKMLSDSATSFPGKTIDELFPIDDPAETADFKPTSEMFDELRSKLKLRSRIAFHLKSSLDTNFVGHTAGEDHGFGFSILWDTWRPESARVSLHSYTLDSLQHRGPFSDHVKEELGIGDAVSLLLFA